MEIRSKFGGTVLQSVDAPSLADADLAGAHLVGALLANTDLSGANLRDAYLFGANLQGADLRGADLTGADLGDAVLIGTRLDDAVLRDASLIGANLSHASLQRADLQGANLRTAYMRAADLTGANLRRANLTGTTLERAVLDDTDLSECPTLPLTLGLESAVVRRTLPARPDSSSAGRPSEKRPEAVQRHEAPQTALACLISHTMAEAPFAEWLADELMQREVKCQRFYVGLRPAAGLPDIRETLGFYDKIVLVCSRSSIRERGPCPEITQTIRRERQAGTQKLFPVRLDGYHQIGAAARLGDQRVADGIWEENWVRYLAGFEIPDFSGWSQAFLERPPIDVLIRSLASPATR